MDVIAEIGDRPGLPFVFGQTVERPILLSVEQKIAKSMESRPALPLADHRVRDNRHTGVQTVGEDAVEFFGA